MDEFLGRTQQSIQSNNTQQIQILLDPAFSSNESQELHNLFLHSPAPSLQDLKSFPKNLQDFLFAFLLFVHAKANGDLETAYSNAEKLFKNIPRIQDEYAWATLLQRNIVVALLSTAYLLCKQLNDNTQISQLADLLRKPLGRALVESNASQASRASSPLFSRSSTPFMQRSSSKGGISPNLLFLANATFRIYFFLRNLRLCSTTMRSLDSIPLSIVPESANVDPDELCEYLYYKGRFMLYSRNIGEASIALRGALKLCRQESYSNARLCMIYATVANLINGTFPHPELLDHFNLRPQFWRIVLALQKGDLDLLRATIDEHRAFHLKYGNYTLLSEKLQVICWRSLVRRVYVIQQLSQATDAGKSPRISLIDVHTAVQHASTLEPVSFDGMTSIITSLFDQGYIRGYLSMTKDTLVLSKKDGFPSLNEVYRDQRKGWEEKYAAMGVDVRRNA